VSHPLHLTGLETSKHLAAGTHFADAARSAGTAELIEADRGSEIKVITRVASHFASSEI
jgi:hypothetical protein